MPNSKGSAPRAKGAGSTSYNERAQAVSEAWRLEDLHPWTKRAKRATRTMLSVMEIILSLKATPLFREVPGEGLKRLSDFIHEKTVASEELIYAEQDLGDEMYLVRSGRVDLFHNIDGEPSLLETVDAGGYFGEMAIIDERPRSAAARARQPTSLLVLHKNDFRAAVQDYPDIAFEVFRELTRRLRAAEARYRELVSQARRLGLETH